MKFYFLEQLKSEEDKCFLHIALLHNVPMVLHKKGISEITGKKLTTSSTKVLARQFSHFRLKRHILVPNGLRFMYV